MRSTRVLEPMASQHLEKVGTVALALGLCPPSVPAQMGEVCLWAISLGPTRTLCRPYSCPALKSCD